MDKKTLIVTAHPDDETLWFTSIALRNRCDVVCVTCGKDSNERQKREAELREAARLLNIDSVYILHYPDIFGDRLDIDVLKKDLQKLKKHNYAVVYTHGPFGDTNEHFHHQDVSYVVNMVFESVKCTAWNIYPDEVNILTNEEYRLKKFILGSIYNREYKKLKTTYEISSVEKFVQLSRDSVYLFYWSIANFGDRHEILGKKYENIWGYGLSPYEIERHAVILNLASNVKPKTILEIGASEGILTDKLSLITNKVECVEKAEVYRQLLLKKGYKVLKTYDSSKYDLTVVASVLEYMDDPQQFLESIKSTYIVIETIMSDHLKKIVLSLKKRYKLKETISVSPRWENMYHDNIKEKMEIYKLGANIYLFELHG